MKIEIRMFATLSAYNRHADIDKDLFINIPEESTVMNLIEQLGIPENDIKLIFVNGRHSDSNKVLSEGDRIGLFPPVGGG